MNKKKIAVYSRSATVNKTWINQQKKVCRDYARKKEWQIITEYTDDGVSGMTGNRQGLQKMLRDAASQEFEILLMYDADRLGRSYPVIINLHDELAKNNIKIVTVKHDFSFWFDLHRGVFEEFCARIKKNKKI